MARIAMGLALLTMLAGCSTQVPLQPIVSAASFADPSCREVARLRSEDSAVNGYDLEIQVRVAQDVYRNCVALKP